VVALVGRVNQPAIYELKRKAGGRSPDAGRGVTPPVSGRVQIERFQANRAGLCWTSTARLLSRGQEENNPVLTNGIWSGVPGDLDLQRPRSRAREAARPLRPAPGMRVSDLLVRDELLPMPTWPARKC